MISKKKIEKRKNKMKRVYKYNKKKKRNDKWTPQKNE